MASHTGGKARASATEEQFSSNYSILLRSRVSTVSARQSEEVPANILKLSSQKKLAAESVGMAKTKLVNCCFSRASVSSSVLCTEACVCKDVFLLSSVSLQ